METQQTQELKAERVQEEMVAAVAKPLQIAEEPFRISLKAERVQEPASLGAPISNQPGGTVSLAYEVSFNQMRAVTVELDEPQIAIHLFATGGLAAA
jgi:hypothetical protein